VDICAVPFGLETLNFQQHVTRLIGPVDHGYELAPHLLPSASIVVGSRTPQAFVVPTVIILRLVLSE